MRLPVILADVNFAGLFLYFGVVAVAAIAIIVIAIVVLVRVLRARKKIEKRSDEIFDQVQDELKRRCPGRNRYSGVHVFSGKVKCGQCGSWYGSKVWHSNDKYRRTI